MSARASALGADRRMFDMGDGSRRGARAAGEGSSTWRTRVKAPRRNRAKRSSRTIVTIALMLAMAVAALEQTVVSTAMPSIIATFKGLEIYPWVFSAYLLASTVTTPLYGKLADLFGRKRLLLFGLGMFMLGSILSGLGAEHAATDRDAGAPGARRGGRRADRGHDARRPLHARRARPACRGCSAWSGVGRA